MIVRLMLIPAIAPSSTSCERAHCWYILSPDFINNLLEVVYHDTRVSLLYFLLAHLS